MNKLMTYVTGNGAYQYFFNSLKPSTSDAIGIDIGNIDNVPQTIIENMKIR